MQLDGATPLSQMSETAVKVSIKIFYDCIKTGLYSKSDSKK